MAPGVGAGTIVKAMIVRDPACRNSFRWFLKVLRQAVFFAVLIACVPPAFSLLKSNSCGKLAGVIAVGVFSFELTFNGWCVHFGERAVLFGVLAVRFVETRQYPNF